MFESFRKDQNKMKNDKNQAVLDALDKLIEHYNSLNKPAFFPAAKLANTIRADVAARFAPSAGVDVSPEIKVAFKALEVAADKKAADEAETISLIPIHAERILFFYKQALTAIPDMREAWQEISTWDESNQSIILVTNGNGTWPAAYRDGKHGMGFYELGYTHAHEGIIGRVTHWQPLPAAPKGGKL